MLRTVHSTVAFQKLTSGIAQLSPRCTSFPRTTYDKNFEFLPYLLCTTGNKIKTWVTRGGTEGPGCQLMTAGAFLGVSWVCSLNSWSLPTHVLAQSSGYHGLPWRSAAAVGKNKYINKRARAWAAGVPLLPRFSGLKMLILWEFKHRAFSYWFLYRRAMFEPLRTMIMMRRIPL
jgi:hypothetical protein